MRIIKIKPLFVLLLLTLLACDDESLESELSNLNLSETTTTTTTTTDSENGSTTTDGENGATTNSEDLIGDWTLVSLNLSLNTATEVSGQEIESDLNIVSFNPNYNLTFTESVFTTSGSYEYSVDIVANGIVIPSEDYLLEDVTGDGNYTTNNNEMTIEGTFFEFSFEGAEDYFTDGEEIGEFEISNNGQTLTFYEDTTESESLDGGVTVITTKIATTVWAKI